MEELLNYMGYGKSLALVFLGAIVVTYIFHRLFREQRWAKYVPGLGMLIFGLYNLTQIDVSTTFIQDNSLVSFVTGTVGGLATLLFGLILGVFNKPKKVKKSRKKQ